jgi:hypothetical protein
MNFRELRACTGRILKGKYRRAFRASVLYPTACLFAWLVPVILAAVLIQHGILTPWELFCGGIPRWALLCLLWSSLRFLFLLPVRLGTWSWFTELSGIAQTRKRLFSGMGAFFHAFRCFLCVELCRLAAALPLALGLSGAAYAFRAAEGLPEGGALLFLAVQCLCIAGYGAIGYARFCAGAAAVPFLFLAQPHAAPLVLLRTSFAVLHGRYAQLVRLVFGYFPAALPVLTIPFLLPYLMTDYTLFVQVCIREWEEKNHARTAFSDGTAAAVPA